MQHLDQAQVDVRHKELYYVAAQPLANGDHLVHRADCAFVPRDPDRRYVGRFAKSFEALRDARQFYVQSNGCPSCLPECHTR